MTPEETKELEEYQESPQGRLEAALHTIDTEIEVIEDLLKNPALAKLYKHTISRLGTDLKMLVNAHSN